LIKVLFGAPIQTILHKAFDCDYPLEIWHNTGQRKESEDRTQELEDRERTMEGRTQIEVEELEGNLSIVGGLKDG